MFESIVTLNGESLKTDPRERLHQAQRGRERDWCLSAGTFLLRYEANVRETFS